LFAVEAIKLAKTFQTRQGPVKAVRSISFAVSSGEIFGILGPNGAGKSTTILMLTTLLRSTDGSANILGLDVDKNEAAVRNKIGVALQETGIDEVLTGKELTQSTGRLWGLSKSKASKRSAELLSLVGLSDAANRRVKTYSGGMKRRLDLALSLIHKPEILFLDEPTTGLDPGSRRVLWNEILRLKNEGVTIILTTQYLEEADALADRIAIIDNGVVKIEGTPDALKASIGGDVVMFSFETKETAELAAEIIKNSELTGRQLRTTVENGPQSIPHLFSILRDNEIEVVAVSSSRPTLDDVFLKVTGHKLEAVKTSGHNGIRDHRRTSAHDA